MKRFCATFLAIAVAAIAGCDRGTPGGPGASDTPTKRPVVSTADDTFTLSVPTLATNIKQGETKAVTIGIRRGKNIGEDVSLKFEGMPKGVTIDPATPSIKAGDPEAKINLKAADDAALGDFTIKVTGHPAKGADAHNDLKITVEKK
jgi:uncharacterized membrane protein